MPDYLPDRRPLIGIAARLSEQKGHADLLTAFAQVQQQLPCDLVIAGDGPLMGELRQQVEDLGIADTVHFLGTRNDVWDLLPHLDLFVLPSYWEGFPIVIIETMSQGVPIVATDITGTRELIIDGETGYLVPPKSPDELAAAMLKSLEYPDQSRALAIRAKEHASQYTIQNVTKCYQRCYQQVLQRPASAS
jgi:glycosyltransferase involved in cell wall biosynthesis